MHISEMVFLYGDEAVEKIYEEIDRRLLDYSNWLVKQSDRFNTMQQEIHLANAHYLVEFMAEDSPCLFPEEVIDQDDTAQAIADETSTTFGLKQFVYCTYICKGPGPGALMDVVLQSVELYYDYLLQTEAIFSIPGIVTDVVEEPAFFIQRRDSFFALNEKFSDDEEGWNKAFDEWTREFYA